MLAVRARILDGIVGVQKALSPCLGSTWWERRETRSWVILGHLTGRLINSKLFIYLQHSHPFLTKPANSESIPLPPRTTNHEPSLTLGILSRMGDISYTS